MIAETPEHLCSQVENFLYSLGQSQSMSFILELDPDFGKFLEQECGLNLDLISKISEIAQAAASTLKQQDGIVTVDNCRRWMLNIKK